jgi:hypothetical protein
LISIDESYQSFTILPPCMEQSAYICQENGAWAVLYPLGLKTAAVLIHDGESITGSAHLERNINGNDVRHVPIMTLKLSPSEAAKVLIIHPGVHHSNCQFPKGELERASILPSTEILMGIVSRDRPKDISLQNNSGSRPERGMRPQLI